MMTLHWSPRSPYVRKVMIAAHEMGLVDRIRTVRTVVAATEPHAGLMRINPQSRLPTLEAEDGTVVYDSPVVCEYLDQLHDGEKLIPPAFPERLITLRRQALGDGMLDTLLMWLGERFRPEEKRSEPHIEAWRVKTRASVAALEREAPALAASRFDLGHIAIGVALGYLDFRFSEMRWRDGHPRLADWQASFDTRPSVIASRPVDDL